jgi:HEAT repeat protein
MLLAFSVVALMASWAQGDPAPAAKTDATLTEKIQKLIRQLGDDQYKVRDEAGKQLIEIGRPAVPALREAMKSDDVEVKHRAGRLVETIRTSMPYLLESLKGTDAVERKEAAEVLEHLGADAKEAVPLLIALLKDKEEEVRDAAIMAMIAIDPENKAITDTGPSKAHVNGKYAKLLRRISVPQDKASYNEFNDYGHYPATDYAGYTGIPEGYWVYVYPNWYIWGELKKK